MTGGPPACPAGNMTVALHPLCPTDMPVLSVPAHTGRERGGRCCRRKKLQADLIYPLTWTALLRTGEKPESLRSLCH